MAFFAPTALAGALLLALVLALAVDLGLAAGVDAFATLVLFLVVALPATCRPFEATVGFAVDLGLAAAVDALAVTALVLGLVVALPATCRPFEATLRVVPLVFERLLRGFFLAAAFVFTDFLAALPAFSGRISSGSACCSFSVCATVCSGCPKACRNILRTRVTCSSIFSRDQPVVSTGGSTSTRTVPGLNTKSPFGAISPAL